MDLTLSVVQIIASVGLVGLILMQQGKGADAGASFGAGASQTFFGGSGSANALTKMTAVLAAVFFVASLGLAYYAKEATAVGSGISLPSELSSDEAIAPSQKKPLDEVNTKPSDDKAAVEKATEDNSQSNNSQSNNSQSNNSQSNNSQSNNSQSNNSQSNNSQSSNLENQIAPQTKPQVDTLENQPKSNSAASGAEAEVNTNDAQGMPETQKPPKAEQSASQDKLTSPAAE